MSGLERNVSGQSIVVIAFDTVTGERKTGDANNISCYYSIDDGTLTELASSISGSPTEVSSTNAKGGYRFSLSQAETDGQYIDFFPQSSTTSPNVVEMVPFRVFTVPAGFSTTAVPTAGTVANAVWDETRTGHGTSGTFGAVLSALPEAPAGGTGGLAIYDNLFSIAESGTISDDSPTTTGFTLSAGFSSTDDFYGGSFIVISSGSRRMTSVITDYMGSTREVTLSPALPATPSDGDGVMILGLNV